MKGNNSIISKIQLRFNVDIETNPFYFIFFFIFFFIIYLSFFKSGVVPETNFFFKSNQIFTRICQTSKEKFDIPDFSGFITVCEIFLLTCGTQPF